MNKQTNFKKPKRFTSVKANEEDFETESTERFCGYFLEQRALTRLVVPIDTEFRDPSYYRMVCDKIGELGEGDIVEFEINSPGGSLSGLVTLLHAIRTTEAETMAVVVGDAYSAASLLALACDSVTIGPYANFLCHSASFGTRGKTADVRGHVNHTANYAENIFRDCYEHFLTEEEITDVLEGKELYLNYEQINERLERKYSILKEMQESECCGDPDNCDDLDECPLTK
jgi:ATP-dependent protease ClpP protease subunit